MIIKFIQNNISTLKDLQVGATFVFVEDKEFTPHIKTDEIKNNYIAMVNLRNGKLCIGAWDEAKVIQFEIPPIEVKLS